MQASWFIVQCIVRAVYGLAVTELEVATLAFATLTGVTYYLWWHKPLDVRCSVPVYLLRADSQSPVREGNHIQPFVAHNSEPNPRELNFAVTLGPNFTQMQQFSAFIQRQQKKHGSLLGIIYVFMLHPIWNFFNALLDLTICTNLEKSSPLRVPTFYGFEAAPNDFFLSCVGTTVGVIFGGIHCVAWSFQFASLQERLMWRISAASVTMLPIIIVASVWLFPALGEVFGQSTRLGKISRPVGLFVLPTFVGLYIFARIILLVLPCIALRALPAAAFIEIQWASLFPHIG